MNIQKSIKFLARIPFDFVVRAAFVLLALPILYILEPFRPTRIGLLSTQRIGHLVGNIEIFIREQQIKSSDRRVTYIFAGWDPASRQLFEMYKRQLPIYENKWLTRLLFSSYPLLSRTRFFEPLGWTNQNYPAFNQGHTTLAFTKEEEAFGYTQLEKMGLNKDDWFVCLHVRDPAYLDVWRPQHSDLWRTRDFRNCKIETYFKAAEYITSIGGYVIRMGAVVESPLPDLGNPRIIDYATKYRSDFMDVFLSAKCRLFISSDSGLFMVATAFGVPVALANSIFLRANPFCSHDTFIPKLVDDVKTGDPLHFQAALEMGFYDDSRPPPNLDNFKYRDNDPGEVLDLVREAICRSDGKLTNPDETAVSDSYRENFMSDLPGYEEASKLGGKFALKYRRLIEQA